MPYEPKNNFKGVREISIPIKVTMYHSGSIWGQYYHRIILPTLGKEIIFPYNEDRVKSLLEFIGTSCGLDCGFGRLDSCKHYRYPRKCYLFEDWIEENEHKWKR